MMDPNDDSCARWLYQQCSNALTAMETPLSALELSIKVLQFIKSIDEDSDDMCQIELFSVLKNEGKAKKRDLSFVNEIGERAIELRDDDECTEEALRMIAASTDGGGDVAEVEEENNVGAESEDHEGAASARSPSGEGMGGPESESTEAAAQDDINFDELHCFQLRTRVLGLNMPTFSQLWKYLQMAGWTYVSGKYFIPKGRKEGTKSIPEDMSKIIFTHFNLDNPCNPSDMSGSISEEEGPETFGSSNELVDYLDEFCMPHYHETHAEIQAKQAASPVRSPAYKRRSKRLRFELLEVAYRELLRKSRSLEQQQNPQLEDVNEKRNNDEGPSKYGHNHRPCEACFKGASPNHPRVACRECGLVVHTYCYGLLDHGEIFSDNKGGRFKTSARKGAEVDEKGFFTCDVCANSLCTTKNKKRWNASQSSGWRVHELPTALCPLCEKKDITGAMVRIVVKGDGSTQRKRGKRKSRKSEESSETWAHLFCINSLGSTSYAPHSIRGSSSAVQKIHSTLDKTSEIVKETESKRGTEIRCESCANGKGDIVECKGTCERFFHRLCLQSDCLDFVDWNEKKEHLCLSCRGIDGVSGTDRLGADHKDEAIPLTDSLEVNAPQSTSSKVDTSQEKNAEVDQYFGRKKSSKKQSKSEGTSSELVVPSPQECAMEVMGLHDQSNADQELDDFELQYQHQFYQWSISLATNQSILLYGLGSKVSLLTSFGDYLAPEGDVISLNGFDQTIDLNQFLDHMDQLFCNGSESHQSKGNSQSASDLKKGLSKRAALVAKTFASTRSRPLFILIHNIDGVGLCNRFAQDTLAALTFNSQIDGTPMIRIAASVDNVNAGMFLWTPEVGHKFDWAWKKVHTYRPYLEEVRNMPEIESSNKAKRGNGDKIADVGTSALKVLTYLAPKNTDVLKILANLQLSGSSNSISYGLLKDECIKKMLTSSDIHLRSVLKELSDHSIIKWEKDEKNNDVVFVPAGIPIRDILNFNLKASQSKNK